MFIFFHTSAIRSQSPFTFSIVFIFFHGTAIRSQTFFIFSTYVHILSHRCYMLTILFHIHVHTLSRPDYMFTIFFHIQYIRQHSFTTLLHGHNLISHSVHTFTFFHSPTICSQSSFTLMFTLFHTPIIRSQSSFTLSIYVHILSHPGIYSHCTFTFSIYMHILLTTVT